jgi:cell division initiation protein
VKLTPLDIRHKEFRRGMRGYSDEDVDVFLDEVADEFERLFQENIEARERIEHLVEQIRHFEALKETLQKTLVSAQQQADEMKANARKEAELIIKDAEIKGRDLVSESYTEKQRVQQGLTKLKQVEEDFRFKFRSLLEAHINLLAEDESSEDRRRFRNIVSDVESDSVPAADAVASSKEAATPWTAEVAPDPFAPSVQTPPLPEAAPVETRREEVGAYSDGKKHTLDDNPFADLEREAALLDAQDAPVFDADSYGPVASPSVEDVGEELERIEIPGRPEDAAQSFGADEDDQTDEQSGEVKVRRFRIGRREDEDEGSAFSQGPQDRDFEW